MKKGSKKTNERGKTPQDQTDSDAVEMLKADHEKVRHLFKQFESASPGEQEGVARQIFQELEIHSTLEEASSIMRFETRSSHRTLR